MQIILTLVSLHHRNQICHGFRLSLEEPMFSSKWGDKRNLMCWWNKGGPANWGTCSTCQPKMVLLTKSAATQWHSHICWCMVDYVSLLSTTTGLPHLTGNSPITSVVLQLNSLPTRPVSFSIMVSQASQAPPVLWCGTAAYACHWNFDLLLFFFLFLLLCLGKVCPSLSSSFQMTLSWPPLLGVILFKIVWAPAAGDCSTTNISSTTLPSQSECKFGVVAYPFWEVVDHPEPKKKCLPEQACGIESWGRKRNAMSGLPS